ncbi:MAG: hypothetical protein CVT89_00980 [Candidatus Altiarchaeales archaeon HGW-Altiarchaeales-2]|nr:MAG: hypothetical protein CVT89_00980 [Candidatus Altiarchaeales archaeon HGW-Altiarchaeales-2]
MKKILITGASGFVAPYLAKEFGKSNYEIFYIDYPTKENKINHFLLDITDKIAVFDLIKKIKPDFIVHLAGFSSIFKSFTEPEECRRINVDGTRNILDALVKYAPKCRTLIVSSIHVYGSPCYSPVDEKHPLNANSPYAESRIEQEKLVNEYDLDILISRSTNHTGPGQKGFVIGDFCKQIVDIEMGLNEPVIYTGNLSTKKDFLDVRDVVKAYKLIIENGKAKEIYNVSSGKNITIEKLLKKLIDQSKVKNIEIKINKKIYRTDDTKEFIIDNTKIKSLGWKTTYSINTTLKDTLDELRKFC